MPRVTPPERKKAILDDADAGMNAAQIARKHNANGNTVRKILAERKAAPQDTPAPEPIELDPEPGLRTKQLIQKTAELPAATPPKNSSCRIRFAFVELENFTQSQMESALTSLRGLL